MDIAFEVDFDNGAGFLTVNLNSNISINYSNSGEKEIKINTYFTDPAIVLSSSFKVNINAEDIPVPAPPNEFSIVVDAVEGNKSTSSGTAYIRYGSGNVSLIKPVIVVEGFDPKNERGFKELFDILNTENLADELYNDGYDLIILNFIDGSDYIQNNAEVLRELIHEVNDRTPAGRENVIIGASMGGLVSRYALALMEATPGEDHETRLFISYDSPQLGANIPLSVQFFAKHMEALNDKGIKQLDSPAAKQMLLYHHSNSDDDGTPSTLRDELISDLAAIGNWPDSPSLRKVAVSNGSGNKLNFDGGDLMVKCSIDLRMIFGYNPVQRYVLSFKLRALNDIETIVFEGSLKNQVRVPDIIPTKWKWQTVSYTSWEEDVVCEQLLDNAPGGKRDSFKETGESLSFASTSVYYDDHCFIPTHSALGIETNDAHYNVHEDPSHNANSYFDFVYFPSHPSDNQEHIVSITEENKQWFINEIKGASVTFQNIYDGENIPNTTLAVDGVSNSITSGTTIALATHANYTMRTNHKTIDGHNWMHHHWNNSESSFKMYDSLHTSTEIDIQKARFKDYNSCTINNSFGTIEGLHFHDPWYRDSSGVQPDAMRPLTEVAPGGHPEVFLDQEFNLPPEEQTPHYTLAAENEIPAPAHELTIPWYFYGWTASGADLDDASAGTTAVVFRQDSAVVTANYKGHLISNQDKVTMHNTTRKIAGVHDALHAVYEDNSQIWYTKSTDEGATWDPEVCISAVMPDDYTGHYNPSLAVLNDAIYVVWEGVTNANGYYGDYLHEIILRKGDISGSTVNWSGSVDYIADNFEGQFYIGTDEARPVVCANPDKGLYIAWRAKPYGLSAPNGAHIAYADLNGNIDMHSFTDIPNCYSFPAIATGNNDSYPSVHILWIFFGDELWSTRGLYDNSTWTWQPRKILNGNNYYDNYSDPSFTLSDGHIGYVTWEAENERENNNKELWYGKYDLLEDSPKISETKVEDNGGPCDPVIMVNGSTSYPAIFYSVYGNIARYKQNSDNTWSVQNFLEGQYPNACPFGESGAVWTKYHSAPYLLGTDYVESSQPSPLPPVVTNPRVREYLYPIYSTESVPDTGYISLKFNKVLFNNETVVFNNPLESDTLIAPVSQIPMELELEVSFYNIPALPADQEILFKVDFMDDGLTIPLTDLRIYELPDTSIVFTKSITANNMHYREGFLKFSFPGLVPQDYWVLVEEDSALSKNSSTLSLDILPDQYSLGQNYPNPFNPLTFIGFNLPAEGEVNLSVYDINGQKVRQLINGKRPAGAHQVVFNGADLASGVYFYRMQAGNFMQTKRMLLIK